MNSKAGCRLVVGGAEDCPDIEYLTGFKPVDATVAMVNGRVKAMVVSVLEYGRACNEAPGVDVYTPEMLGLKPEARGKVSGWAKGLLKRYGIKNVTVAPTLYYAVAQALTQARIKLNISKGLLFPEREVKSQEEIAKIAASQQAAVIAMRHAVNVISHARVDHAGCLRVKGRHLTSEALIDSATRVLIDHGCVCKQMIIAGGTKSANPHERGSGRLKAGETIIMDIFPQHMNTGYWGDLTRTVVKGKASPYIKKMYNAVKAAQAAALSMLKPGVTGKSVHLRVCRELEKRGFPVKFPEDSRKGFRHGTGHGVGLCIHESPSLSMFGGRLRKGHVITVEPGWYDPEIGGVRIEDTVVITSNGWKYLVPCEKRLEI